MRRAAVLIAACAASLCAATAVSADNGPHVKGQGGLLTSSCAMCHRAHTGKAPDLLKAESVEALCYTCHGSSGTGSNLDVADGVGYPTGEHGTERTGTPAALRGGGFKYAMINSGHPSGIASDGDIPVLSSGAPVTSAHTVNSSSQIAWGNGPISASENLGAPIKLNCASCHDPHGNGNYRILRPIPEESEATTEVNITEPPGTTKEYTTTNYWIVEEQNNENFLTDISKWCGLCHTRLFATDGSAEKNSGDAVYAYRHATNGTSQGAPDCIQCHVAHGTDATMEGYAAEVNLPNGEPSPGNSYLLRIDNRGTCMMCHSNI